MKRCFAILLSCVFLLGAVCIPASADEVYVSLHSFKENRSSVSTVTNVKPIKVTTVAQLDTLKSSVISGTLTASAKGTNSQTTKLSEADLADLADLDYGFSVIGMRNVGRLDRLTDGQWSVSKQCANFWPTGLLYDKTGAVKPETAEDPDNYIYTGLFTFNFGKVRSIDSFGFIVPNINNLPQSFDIYISNNGTDWTLIGYYDRMKCRTEGREQNDFATIDTGKTLEWTDSSGVAATSASYAGIRFYHYPLPENTSGQYLRLASTAYNGSTFAQITNYTNSGISTYNAYSTSSADCIYQWYEALVFGNPAVTMNSVQTKTATEENPESFDARFIASVEEAVLNQAENAKQINFKISASYTDATHTTPVAIAAKTYTVTKVYTSVIAAGERVDAPEGYRFAMFTVTGIPSDVNVTFTVVPQVKYNDGSFATGIARSYTFTVPASET